MITWHPGLWQAFIQSYDKPDTQGCDKPHSLSSDKPSLRALINLVRRNVTTLTSRSMTDFTFRSVTNHTPSVVTDHILITVTTVWFSFLHIFPSHLCTHYSLSYLISPPFSLPNSHLLCFTSLSISLPFLFPPPVIPFCPFSFVQYIFCKSWLISLFLFSIVQHLFLYPYFSFIPFPSWCSCSSPLFLSFLYLTSVFSFFLFSPFFLPFSYFFPSNPPFSWYFPTLSLYSFFVLDSMKQRNWKPWLQ